MEGTISFTPAQLLLSVAIQAWIILFPVLILKKLNQLIALMQEHFGKDAEA